MSQNSLIIVADDFGISEAVSQGIIEACSQGPVTAVSVMTNLLTPRVLQNLLKQLPLHVDCGLHFNLTSGRPVCPAHEVTSLVDHHGNFFSARQVVTRAILGLLKKQDINREACAQFDRLKTLGASISHMDSHHHIHVLPGICKVLALLAKKNGVCYVRSLAHGPLGVLEGSFFRRFFLGILPGARAAFWVQRGFVTADYFRGHYLSGGQDLHRQWRIALEKLSVGVTEIMVHPGFADEKLGDPYKCGREIEKNYLCGDPLRQLLQDKRVHLTNFLRP